MEQTEQAAQKIFRVVKALLVAYIVTAVCLIILAALLLKMDLSEGNVNIGIIVTYLLSSFLGGFILGKTMGKRKFIWGIVLGAAYFVIAIVISMIAYAGIASSISHVITTMLICIGGGMAGGMIS